MKPTSQGLTSQDDAYHRWDGTIPEGPQAQLIAKAWGDADFKKRLLADPKRVIAEELGIKLPDTWEMKVVEETPRSHYLVLPARPAPRVSGQLADEELEAVAAGKGSGGGGLPPKETTPRQCINTAGDVVMDD